MYSLETLIAIHVYYSSTFWTRFKC